MVIWLGCDGSSESHHRNALRKNGVTVSKQSFIYIDALEEILEQQEASTRCQDSALERLHMRIEEQLSVVTRYTQEDENYEHSQEGTDSARCLVVVDDASALAWSISALDEEMQEESQGEKKVDHRLQMLLSKRKGAIRSDTIGVGLGKWIEERLRKTCDAVSSAVFVHSHQIDIFHIFAFSTWQSY